MASPYTLYDGARVSRESLLGKELAKHEKPLDWTPEKNPFPKMLYRARHRPDGRRSVGEVQDSLFPAQGERGPVVVAGAAEQWTRQCQLTVHNEAEMNKAMESGWRKHPQEALDYLEARDNAASNITAERHYTDARMSEPAQREAAEADKQTIRQVPSVPEKPLARRRGRPPKAESPAGE